MAKNKQIALERIKHLVRGGDNFKIAIKEIEIYCEKKDILKKYLSELIQLENRLRKFEEEDRRDLLTREEKVLTRNKLVYSLTQIVSSIEEDIKELPPKHNESSIFKSQNNRYLLLTIIFLLVFILFLSVKVDLISLGVSSSNSGTSQPESKTYSDSNTSKSIDSITSKPKPTRKDLIRNSETPITDNNIGKQALEQANSIFNLKNDLENSSVDDSLIIVPYEPVKDDSIPKINPEVIDKKITNSDSSSFIKKLPKQAQKTVSAPTQYTNSYISKEKVPDNPIDFAILIVENNNQLDPELGSILKEPFLKKGFSTDPYLLKNSFVFDGHFNSFIQGNTEVTNHIDFQEYARYLCLIRKEVTSHVSGKFKGVLTSCGIL